MRTISIERVPFKMVRLWILALLVAVAAACSGSDDVRLDETDSNDRGSDDVGADGSSSTGDSGENGDASGSEADTSDGELSGAWSWELLGEIDLGGALGIDEMALGENEDGEPVLLTKERWEDHPAPHRIVLRVWSAGAWSDPLVMHEVPAGTRSWQDATYLDTHGVPVRVLIPDPNEPIEIYRWEGADYQLLHSVVPENPPEVVAGLQVRPYFDLGDRLHLDVHVDAGPGLDSVQTLLRAAADGSWDTIVRQEGDDIGDAVYGVNASGELHSAVANVVESRVVVSARRLEGSSWVELDELQISAPTSGANVRSPPQPSGMIFVNGADGQLYLVAHLTSRSSLNVEPSRRMRATLVGTSELAPVDRWEIASRAEFAHITNSDGFGTSVFESELLGVNGLSDASMYWTPTGRAFMFGRLSLPDGTRCVGHCTDRLAVRHVDTIPSESPCDTVTDWTLRDDCFALLHSVKTVAPPEEREDDVIGHHAVFQSRNSDIFVAWVEREAGTRALPSALSVAVLKSNGL